MLDLLKLKSFFLTFGSLSLMIVALALYLGTRLLANAGSKITIRSLITRLSIKPIIFVQFAALAGLIYTFISCLYATLLSTLILNIEFTILLLNIIFLTERRGGKRQAIFKSTIIQLAAIHCFYFICYKLAINNGNQFYTLSIQQFKDIMLNLTNLDWLEVVMIHSLIICLLLMLGFSPFTFNFAFLFKKQSLAEKILYIGFFCNLITYLLIKLFAGFNYFKYLAIIYLAANAFSLAIARKVDEIIFNLINFGISVALLLLCIENISTNYASLMALVVLVFALFTSAVYNQLYKDSGFAGKPGDISIKIAKLGLANKHKVQAFFLCAISLSLMSTPLSLALFPYMFLQIFTHSRLFNYCIIIICFAVISFAIVRLCGPFVTCLKYARPIFTLKYPKSSIYARSYKLITMLMINVCIATFVIALIINFNRSNTYKEFYLFDTSVMFFMCLIASVLFYKSRYYVMLLGFTKFFRARFAAEFKTLNLNLKTNYNNLSLSFNTKLTSGKILFNKMEHKIKAKLTNNSPSLVANLSNFTTNFVALAIIAIFATIIFAFGA